MLQANRVLPLEGGINFRDLGGYTTVDGAQVCWGKLFRSGNMSTLTDQDCAYLRKLDIRSVCDFRSNSERIGSPTQVERFGSGIAYVSWDYDQVIESSLLAGVFNGSDPARAATELMAGFYRGMPAFFGARFAVAFDALKQGDGMVFHCSAGKDRTGMMAALLLSALGVEESQIFDDYDLTNRVLGSDEHSRRATGLSGESEDPAMAMFARMPPEAMEAFMGVKPDYLQAAFDSIRDMHGSMEAYLDNVLGLTEADIADLRACYLVR